MATKAQSHWKSPEDFRKGNKKAVTKISKYKQRLLMLAMYETETKGKAAVPKVILSADNFAHSLSHMDLEDLVCAYIHSIHWRDGYMLLPSSGKVNELKYEFTFASGDPNKKTVTCQVKNQNNEPVNIADYENDKDIYEKIYLFSGNDNFVGRELAKDNIETIDKRALFDVLKRGA